MTSPARDPPHDAPAPAHVLAVVDACRSLADLEAPLKRLLAAGLVERSFADGDAILSQGQPGEGVFLVSRGNCAVRLRDTHGTRDDASEARPHGDAAGRELARLDPGDVFGEMSLLTKEAVTADVLALGPVTAFQLGVEDFERIARQHPELGIVLTYLIGERLGVEALDGLGGKTLDRYRIERCVGRGAMAVVYRAREADAGSNGPPIALKMMSHRLVYESGAMQRFEAEADIQMSLEHEDIARLRRRFDAFGTAFLAMEYCDGDDLQKVVDTRGALPEAEVRKITGHLAAALRHLHGRGIIHRDLKPSNVMTTRDGGVKLTDFGLATAACAPGDRRTGSSLGTPLYMAPEQLGGAPPSPASDLYALGCVILELATGRRAFTATSLEELLARKFDFRLPPARRIGPGVSWKLHRLLKKLLAKDPEARAVPLERYAAWRGDTDLRAS